MRDIEIIHCLCFILSLFFLIPYFLLQTADHPAADIQIGPGLTPTKVTTDDDATQPGDDVLFDLITTRPVGMAG